MADFKISLSYVADLPNEYLEKHELKPLNYKYYIDNVESKDDGFKSISAKDFYDKILAGKEPVTSQVNASEYIELFSEYLDKGLDVLHIEFSSGLSGSFNSARIAVEELKEKYPDRKIVLIDSLCASLGYGLLINEAIKKKAEGKSIDEVAEYIEATKLKVNHWFTVDDLHHLKRGGRVSGAAAVIGTALQIKPVLNVDDEGHLIPQEKVRGRKKALSFLVDKMADKIVEPDGQDIFISHSFCVDDAEYVAGLIKERFPKINSMTINYIGPVIGSHTGVGTVALFFIGNSR
ncbi:MAG: DegV family protein [Eubacteriales bacterium]